MAQYTHLSEPDSEFAPFLEQMAAVPQLFDVEARRKRTSIIFTEQANKTYGPKLPQESEYRLEDHQVQVEGGEIIVRTLVPTPKDAQGSDATYPLMVWMHGGGWTTGAIEMDDYQLRCICVELQLSILNVDYRLAPENKHPTQVNDCYAALKWAAESPELFSADLKKGFIVGGLSAGAHLANVLVHRARDDPFFKDRSLTGHVLQIPPLVHPDATPEEYKGSLLSFEQNKDAPILSAESVRWLWAQLGASPTDPEASPLLFPSHKGLPPVIIQVCGLDPLRDEGLLYDRILTDLGVRTRTTIYPGVPHGFQYMFSSFKLAKKWEEDYRSGLRWLLDGAPL